MKIKVRILKDFNAPLADGTSKLVSAGTELELAAAKAELLIEKGIATGLELPWVFREMQPPVNHDHKPYINQHGHLVIPHDGPRRYRWWQGGQPPSETLRELWEERAAIAEFDGGLTRAEAEALATACTGYTPQTNNQEDTES